MSKFATTDKELSVQPLHQHQKLAADNIFKFHCFFSPFVLFFRSDLRPFYLQKYKLETEVNTSREELKLQMVRPNSIYADSSETLLLV